MKITRELLRKWGECYNEGRTAELVPEDGLTPLEVAALDIPAEDRLWVLLREDIIPARELRLLACGWAEAACQKTGWDNEHSLNAIAVARRYACGDATAAEAKAAARAAWAAAARSSESDRAKAAAAVSAAASTSSVAAEFTAARSAEAAARSTEVAEESDRAAAVAAVALAAARAEQLADVIQVLIKE